MCDNEDVPHHERDFKCKFCDKYFESIGTLRFHENTNPHNHFFNKKNKKSKNKIKKIICKKFLNI